MYSHEKTYDAAPPKLSMMYGELGEMYSVLRTTYY